MAFLLHRQNTKPSYIFGKVELIDETKLPSNSIIDLELNSTLVDGHIIATGKDSRTEIINKNGILRIGSLTVAKWVNENSIWMHSGSILFCSESRQSLNISTTNAKANISGKGTMIIEATQNGGFKFIPLEGKGTISTVKGGTKEIIGGRMLLVLDNPTYFGDAYDIDIMLMLKSSRLINSFPKPLPTFEKIGLAVYIQDLKLKGKYDAIIGDAITNENLQVWKFGKAKDANPKKSTPRSIQSCTSLAGCKPQILTLIYFNSSIIFLILFFIFPLVILLPTTKAVAPFLKASLGVITLF